MYKLKIKSSEYESITTNYYKTLQEVADRMKQICNASTLQEILKAQKEYNIRFYISEVKNIK